MPRRAAFLDPGRSLEDGTERVRSAEALGYQQVFVTQTLLRDPLQVLAHYGSKTRKIGLATGVVPILTRHPVQLAMEAATLDEASGGRHSLGIGISHRLTVEGWWGIPFTDPVGRMEEYTTIVRALFRDASVSFEGKHWTARFGFAGFRPRPDIPILFAALGPNMLKLAARLADGVVLWMCSPSHIARTIRPILDKALADAGRADERFDIVAAVPLAVTEHVDAARRAFRQRALPYTQLPFYRKEIAASGFEDMLAAVDAAMAGGGDPLEALSDDFVDAYAGIGDAATARAKVAEYEAAGVTVPAIAIQRGQEALATLEAVAP